MRTFLAAAFACTLTTAASAQVSDATRAANAAFAQTLPWADREDEDFANSGFIAGPEIASIGAPDGRVIWDFRAYDFLQGEAPETVNPSLWRHARLLTRSGLFRVSDSVYQVRGFDVANMTIIKGDTGLIIIDPLTSSETARAALELVHRHIGQYPVRAIIYSHTHIDHFGGARGVIGVG